MRAIVVMLAAAGLSFAGLAACDPPPGSGPVGAAEVEPPPKREPLPDAVEKTVAELQRIAREGTYRDMARLADQTPNFRSNNAGMTHSEYWYLKMRAGDWPMAQAAKLLTYRFTVASTGQGKVYIWPWMAMLKPEEITPAAALEIDGLLGKGQAAQLRTGAIWPGYVLGIREDGRWLYFVSGSD